MGGKVHCPRKPRSVRPPGHEVSIGSPSSDHTFVYCMHSGSVCDHVPSARHTGGLASSGSGRTYPARHVIFNLSPGTYQNFSGMIRPLGGSPGYSHLALPAIVSTIKTQDERTKSVPLRSTAARGIIILKSFISFIADCLRGTTNF